MEGFFFSQVTLFQLYQYFVDIMQINDKIIEENNRNDCERKVGMIPVKPEIISFLIADMLIQEKGTNKWSAIGIFDRIRAAGFPYIHPGLSLYIRLADAEGHYDVRVEFCDTSDHVLALFEGISLSIQSRLHQPDLAIKTANLTIPEPGKYYFKLYFNGAFAKGFRLDVEEVPQKLHGK